MRYLLLCFLLFVGGCPFSNWFLEHGTDIEKLGQLAESTGKGLALTAPEIGGVIFIVGGILIVAGKLLSNIRKK